MKKIIITFLSLIFTISIAFSQTSLSGSGIGHGKSVDFSSRSVNATYFLTHSNYQTIMADNTIGCRNTSTGYTTPNSYMRVFDLVNEFSINEYINITSVDFGIESAVGATGGQPATVNIYTLTGPLLFANLTLIASQPVIVLDQALTLLNVPINAIIPMGSVVVVEIYTPDGRPSGDALFIGSNDLGETAPSYLSASECSIIEPTTTSSLGYSWAQFVINVHAEPSTPEIPISNWAIYLSIFLILVFFAFYFRRRLA